VIVKERLDRVPAGRWLIYTEGTRYLTDFDRRTVEVWPEHVFGGQPHLQLDLVDVSRCEVGQPLTMLVRRCGDDHEFERNAGAVTRLCQLFTQKDVDRHRRSVHTE
jgi:hypothetical protein